MKKILLIFLFVILVFTGCDNKEEDDKSVYLDVKSKLFAQQKMKHLICQMSQ